ncbi:hypothetical protein HanIR_Chr05g0251521 [Helianthus annuus]|nr:hypothetical protein HanIR_Chr05g0251521 [Helianthus annuus]
MSRNRDESRPMMSRDLESGCESERCRVFVKAAKVMMSMIGDGEQRRTVNYRNRRDDSRPQYGNQIDSIL